MKKIRASKIESRNNNQIKITTELISESGRFNLDEIA